MSGKLGDMLEWEVDKGEMLWLGLYFNPFNTSAKLTASILKFGVQYCVPVMRKVIYINIKLI